MRGIMPKFSWENHEKRMREILTPKPSEAQQVGNVLQDLLNKAKIKKPGKGVPRI